MPNANVFQRLDDRYEPGVWSVEIIDQFGDGEIELTVFYGPYSEARARQYAQLVEREPLPDPLSRPN